MVHMIRLRIIDADILDSTTDAIMLPIDGMLPANANARLVDRSLGRIARAFSTRYRDCELADEIESQIEFPVPLGSAAQLELPPGSNFRFALLLSILAHHGDHTSEAMLRTAASSALAHALRLCDSLSISTVSVPLLKGGWRISSSLAMTLMLDVLAHAQTREPLDVVVCILNEPDAVVAMRELARTFGFDSQ